MEVVDEDNNNNPRRSLRLALSEINEAKEENTPNKNSSPDEMVIIQRGPRRKPITWSPVDYDRSKILAPPRDRTPEPSPVPKAELNPKLRRRLVLSPGKNSSQDLGLIIAKKLKSLKGLEQFTNSSRLD